MKSPGPQTLQSTNWRLESTFTLELETDFELCEPFRNHWQLSSTNLASEQHHHISVQTLFFCRSSIPTAIRRLLENISRSATFLSAFITIIYVCVCTFRRTLQDDNKIGYFMGAALCGLSLAIEKDFRREEIALYCVPRALHSVLTQLASTKLGQRMSPFRTVWEIALFSASTAVMMGHFDIHSKDISRTHLWVMERVFGR